MALQVFADITQRGRLVENISTVNASALPVPMLDTSEPTNCLKVTLNQAATQLRLPGAASHVAFTAGRRQYTAASITGDIDVRVKAALTKWTGGGSQTLVAKTGATAGWRLSLGNSGVISFIFSVDGTNEIAANSTVSLPFAHGATGWVRAVRNVTGGTVTLYWSRDGVTWTQLGATISGLSTTATYDNSAIDYSIGQVVTGSFSLVGDVHYVDVRSGIAGTTMLPTDPTSWSSATSGTQTPYAAQTATTTGTRLKLYLAQDSTGGRTVTWPANVLWHGGYMPPLSAGASSVDVFELDWDGTNWLIRPLVNQSPTPAARVDIQKFTSSGTWVKPPWATTVVLLGFGGGGGAGAARCEITLDALDVPGQLTITVGGAGAGAAAITTNDTDGAAGTSGGSTTFGSILTAIGGPAGGGGGSGAGGAGGLQQPAQFPGGAGGGGSVSGGAGNPPTTHAIGGGSGGGAGGGITAADVANAGGGAYSTSDNPTFTLTSGGGVGGGGANGTDRTPVSTPLSGSGGTGSGGYTGGSAGVGGSGGKYGGGGGGGGASVNPNQSGPGGNGAAGIAWVISRG